MLKLETLRIFLVVAESFQYRAQGLIQIPERRRKIREIAAFQHVFAGTRQGQKCLVDGTNVKIEIRNYQRKWNVLEDGARQIACLAKFLLTTAKLVDVNQHHNQP